jgi:hypothetical protein
MNADMNACRVGLLTDHLLAKRAPCGPKQSAETE